MLTVATTPSSPVLRHVLPVRPAVRIHAPAATRHNIVLVRGIHHHAQHDLTVVVEVGCFLRAIFGLRKGGRSIAAKMAIIAITTSSSIKVKARFWVQERGRVFMVLRSY